MNGFVDELREQGRSNSTIARRLRTLKAGARWAHRRGWLREAPFFEMPKGAGQKSEGRPLDVREFNKALEAVPKVVAPEDVDAWRFFLRGLWLSGLRLSESLRLRWDRRKGGPSIVMKAEDSVFEFPTGGQKSRRVEEVPAAPDSVQLLYEHWETEGFDFKGLPSPRTKDKIGRVVTAIGKAARVVVDARTVKIGSAHDLRRSFGLRWSRRVLAAILKDLMRHKSIATTLTYYACAAAESAPGTYGNELV